MYLKSIDIQGFKSFANKMKFEFHNGITGIVGPNGSGKSNVADAVRWVLGEQKTRQLRSSKMEDVIFSGTENRKPLGFAYVAITLDNTDHMLAVDYDEVIISRRLFRSGESEYMINGSACRLKDINEMFYDTGIGKEGYSIIGQGQIDRILSGKPEERRELFDEAAGIVKFKRRKREAMKKLEDEDQNLIRVEDILHELEKQVGPLEKQSEKAKEYLRLRDELRVREANAFLLQIKQIRKQKEETQSRIAIAENDLTGANQELEQIKQEYEKLEQLLEHLNQIIDEKKSGLSGAGLQKEKLEGQIRVLEEQIRSARTNSDYANERIESTKKSLEEHEASYGEFSRLKEENEASVKETVAKQANTDSMLTQITEQIHALEEQTEAYKAEMITLLNARGELQAKMQRYDTLLEQIVQRKEELSRQMEAYNTDQQKQQEVIDGLKKELTAVLEQIADTQKQLDACKESLAAEQENGRQFNRELEQVNARYHQDETRLETLRNLTERYEGYGNSIKKLMELKDSQQGIVGVVADIIQTDKKYEVAIETALGASIQNIVTDTETTAKELIEYLKKYKLGRATFLPLSSMSNRIGFQNEAALREPGVIGLACDLVKTKEKYSGIAKYLLGRIVVVDEVDHAITLARKYRYTLRIVTLEGEQLNPGGSMSGGAFKNSSNLLGRRRELAELEKALTGHNQERERLGKAIVDNREVRHSLSAEIERIQNVLQEQMVLENTIRMNLDSADDRQAQLQSSYTDFERETGEIDTRFDDLQKDNVRLQDDLKDTEDRNVWLEQEIVRLTGELEQQKQEAERYGKEGEENRIAMTSLKNHHDYIVENMNRLSEEISDLRTSLEEILSGAKDTDTEISAREQAITGLKEASLAQSAQMEALEQEIAESIRQKDEQMQEHKEFFRRREEIAERVSALDRELYRLNGQNEKLNESEDNLVDYMWQEYEMSYGQAQNFRSEEAISLSEYKKQISGLKGQMKALGDVNIGAIEEFKAVGERYTFLKGQYEDLMTAKESLLGIITELDTGMRRQFKEKFGEIRAEFDNVFKELFGGGKGEIELDTEGDILDAGIHIIAQPPGKKLQNMMQMSGGEKALTAICLLFAIQNLKPSPFCLLDEIEAALDDSNVVRYAEYLHKLTEHTQFIVITHRRGTMNCADRLYGITMQEKGVSTLVSVDLLESQLDK